jgi:hypothetical protein
MPFSDPPPVRDGDPAEPALRLLYCAASTHLAISHPSVFPQKAGRPDARPAVHLAYAATRGSEALIRDILIKYDAVRASLAPERTETADPTWNAMWPGPVLWWAARLDRRKPSDARSGSPAPLTALRTLVAWLHRNNPERGQSALRLWFAEESVHLAALGGYSNPARNDADPLSHLAWCVRQRPTTVIRDLLDKSEEQFHLQTGKGPAAATDFCAGLLARAVSWGSLPAPLLPRGAPLTAVPSHWSSWCRARSRRNGDERLWPEVSHMTRASAVRLIQQERAFVESEAGTDRP